MWQDHSLVVPARGVNRVRFTVRPGFSLQWQFCIDGIAADIGFGLAVEQYPEQDEHKQLDEVGKASSPGAVSLVIPALLLSSSDADSSSSDGEGEEHAETDLEADADFDVGLKAETEVNATVKTGAKKGVRTGLVTGLGADAGAGAGADADAGVDAGAAGSTEDAQPVCDDAGPLLLKVPWRGVKAARPRAAILRRLTGITGDAGDAGAAVERSTAGVVSSSGAAADAACAGHRASLGLRDEEWLLAQGFCTHGVDHFGSGVAVRGAWHCSAARTSAAPLVLTFCNKHSRLRPKRISLYVRELSTQLLRQEEERDASRRERLQARQKHQQPVGEEHPPEARVGGGLFRGDLKVEIIRGRHFDCSAPPMATGAGGGDEVLDGEERYAAAEPANGPWSPHGVEKTSGADGEVAVAGDDGDGGNAAEFGVSTMLHSLTAALTNAVSAHVGALPAPDKPPPRAPPASPYVCVSTIPGGRPSSPACTGCCTDAGAAPCWRGATECTELVLPVMQADTALRLQVWNRHRLLPDELVGEVQLSLKVAVEADAGRDSAQRRSSVVVEANAGLPLGRAAWCQLRGNCGGQLLVSFSRVLAPEVEKIVAGALTCNKCGKTITAVDVAGDSSDGDAQMAAVEAHLAFCAAARKAARKAETKHVTQARCKPTRTLRLSIYRAALQDVQVFGVQSPYATATTLPSRGSVASTKCVEGGGVCPRWDGGDDNAMVLDVAENDTAVSLEVWNSNTMIDDALGKVELPLRDLVSCDFDIDAAEKHAQKRLMPEGCRTWRDLEPEGRIQCSMEWIARDDEYSCNEPSSPGSEGADSRTRAASTSAAPSFTRLPQLVTPWHCNEHGASPRKSRYSSSMISRDLAASVENELPRHCRGYDWHMLYSLVLHGCDIATFFRRCREHSNTILFAKTTGGDVLGGFATETWKTFGGYHGTADAFVFSASPSFRAFHPVRKARSDNGSCDGGNESGQANNCFQIGFNRAVAMGGGGTFAFCLGADFAECSTGFCQTFSSPPLGRSELFECADVEVWGLAPAEFGRKMLSPGHAGYLEAAGQSGRAAEDNDGGAGEAEQSTAGRGDRASGSRLERAATHDTGGKALSRKPTAWF